MIRKDKVLTIEKGVPVPSAAPDDGDNREYHPVYPWRLMEIGDSFLWESPPLDTTLGDVGGSLGFKLVSRTVTEDGVKRVRIWRIK